MIKKLIVILLTLLLPVAVYANPKTMVCGTDGSIAGVISNRLNTTVNQSTASNLNATVDLNAGSSIVVGQTSIAAVRQGVPLSSTSVTILSVTITPLDTNTGDHIYIGNDATVNPDASYILATGSVVTIDVDNLMDIFIDANGTTDGVSYLGLVK